MEKLSMADLLPNGLAVQIVKKIPLKMFIGQQIKEEGYDQN